jgi:hypothetical protein
MSKRYCLGVVVVVLLLAGSGCSKRVKVEGTVTLNGKPLHWATVSFVPATGDERLGSGVSDENGKFKLSSEKVGDGLYPGDYRVVVTVAMPPPQDTGITTNMTSKEAMALAFEAMKRQRDEWKRLGKTLPIIPKDYQNAGQTPLRVRVPPDGPVVLDIKADENAMMKELPLAIPPMPRAR